MDLQRGLTRQGQKGMDRSLWSALARSARGGRSDRQAEKQREGTHLSLDSNEMMNGERW